MKTNLLRLILAGALFASPTLFAAGAGNPFSSFDLFGLPLSSLELDLGKRAQALGQALAAAFPKDFRGEFRENSYSGRCYMGPKDQYKLSWKDSETEGFSFTVERSTDAKTCENPFSSGMTLPSGPLPPEGFFPVSRSHPSLQIGTSTLAQVQKEMGRATYSSPTELAYFFKRDRAKEKGCGYNVGKGELAGIMAVFRFDVKGILQSIALENTISGEC